MKFLKINAKVLMILCLFSGILFLSTGCGEKTEDDENTTSEVDNKTTNTTDKNQTNDNSHSTTNDQTEITKTDEVSKTNETTKTNTTDYSVWVANTTINTDKSKKSYKVIWGDTLWLISTAWEVPYQEIARYNNIPNPDLIYVDQIIYNPQYK